MARCRHGCQVVESRRASLLLAVSYFFSQRRSTRTNLIFECLRDVQRLNHPYKEGCSIGNEGVYLQVSDLWEAAC